MILIVCFVGRGRRAGPQKGKDVIHQLKVSLEDLYNGAVRKLALQKNAICTKCEGRGGKKGAVQTCGNCRGTGMQIRVQQLGPGMVQQIQSMCHECQGQGESISAKDRCKNCQGRKVTRERKILEVHIDKGKGDFCKSSSQFSRSCTRKCRSIKISLAVNQRNSLYIFDIQYLYLTSTLFYTLYLLYLTINCFAH